MREVDVSIGMKQELYEGVRACLDSEDREIFDDYSPKDIAVHQRINGRGMRWHDAQYLWMRLLRDTGRHDFGSTVHKMSRVTVIREDAVLEAVNGLRLDHRKRLLRTVEKDLGVNRRREGGVWAVLEDLNWDRHQTFKDLLLRGNLSVDTISQERGGFFSDKDMEAFATILEYHHPQEPVDSEEYASEEDVSVEPSEAEEDIGEVAAELEQELSTEATEEQRLHQAVVDAWRAFASPEESELLANHDGERLHIELYPYFKRLFLPRLGVRIGVESIMQSEHEGERLWMGDDHTAKVKHTEQGRVFAQSMVRTVPSEDRRLLIAKLDARFREDVRSEVKYMSEYVEYLRRCRCIRLALLSWIHRKEQRLYKEEKDTVTQLL